MTHRRQVEYVVLKNTIVHFKKKTWNNEGEDKVVTWGHIIRCSFSLSRNSPKQMFYAKHTHRNTGTRIQDTHTPERTITQPNQL